MFHVHMFAIDPVSCSRVHLNIIAESVDDAESKARELGFEDVAVVSYEVA